MKGTPRGTTNTIGASSSRQGKTVIIRSWRWRTSKLLISKGFETLNGLICGLVSWLMTASIGVQEVADCEINKMLG
jgi:hypothetical protein